MNHNDLLAQQKFFTYRKIAKTKENYIKLQRNRYHNLKGYPKYDHIAELLASHLFTVSHTPFEDIVKDRAFSTIVRLSYMAANYDIATYALTSDLFEAFQHTELPKNICQGLKQVIPFGFLLFPNSGLRTPDNLHLDWVLFNHRIVGNKLPDMYFSDANIILEHEVSDVPRLHWGTSFNNAMCYSSECDLPEDESEPQIGDLAIRSDEYQIKKADIDEKYKKIETDFVTSVDKIILQTLLYLQLYPNDIELVQTLPEAKGIGFGRNSKITPKTNKNVLVIGNKFVQKRDYTPHTNSVCKGGSHASPSTHWRIGHYRKVPCGKNGQDRKITWIRPVLVNPSNE